jgi:pimeloyl-ACP methyl ester carboxylesterase
MPAEKPHELWPFTSQEARERYLAHYDALEKLWPVDSEKRTVRTDHGETFVRISGPIDAPPVVLLPGGQSTSLVWRRLIEPLSARFRTYALDSIYDVGRSLPARPMADVAELTGWLDAVLDALGLTDGVHMMGISYGAYVVAEYALHAPQRLRRIVWISPVMVAAPISQEFVNRIRQCAEPGREPIEAFCRWVMPSLAASDRRAFDDRVDEILLSRECYSPRMPPVRRPALSDDELRSIDVPALYILGAQDGATENPREVLARLGVVAPQIETMLIPGAGHDAVVAQPRLIAERVLQFLGESQTSRSNPRRRIT